MRKSILAMMLVAFACATSAQFTLLPQAGMENPITKISYNNLPSFDPLTSQQLSLGLRADYKFKGGFGPYVGIGTSRSGVKYSFADPETGMNLYTAEAAKFNLQLNAGIQYSSKALSLGKGKSKNKAEAVKNSEKKTAPTVQKFYYNRCGQKIYYSCQPKTKPVEVKKTPAKNLTMRLQPSLGMIYIPTDQPAIESKTGGYTYNAGQVKTAITGGMGFEFARGKSRIISLRVNYFNGLEEQNTLMSTQAGNKSVNTTLSSKVSGWSTMVGIPISFDKKAAKKKVEKKKNCEQKTYYRCSEKKVIRF